MLPRKNPTDLKLGCLMIGIGITAVLVKLALVGGIIYAAIHFIQKYW